MRCAAQPYDSTANAATLSARAQPIADEHRLGDRVVAVVRERQQHAIAAALPRDLARAPAQDQHRRAAALALHLELAPADAEPQPGAERLQPGFLGGEAGGEVRHGILACAAVRDLVLGEDPAEEAVLPALEQVPHPRDGHE